MNRKRYMRKMTALMVAIHRSADSKGNSYRLGKALNDMKKVDLTKALMEYGSYDNIWNSEVMQDLRGLYGL